MHRRVLTAWMLCIGLLFASLPAFACATMTGDCCDPAHEAPCKTVQVDPTNAVEIAYCSPAVSAPLSVVSSKEIHSNHYAIDDSPLAATVSHSNTKSRDFKSPLDSPVITPLSFGTRTYLKTGRLRL